MSSIQLSSTFFLSLVPADLEGIWKVFFIPWVGSLAWALVEVDNSFSETRIRDRTSIISSFHCVVILRISWKKLCFITEKKMPMPIFAQKTIQMPTRKFTLVKQQLKKYRNRISSTLNIIYCSYSCTIHCHGKCYCTFERFNKIQNPSLGFLISINKTIEMLLIYYRILNEIFFWLKRMKVTY